MLTVIIINNLRHSSMEWHLHYLFETVGGLTFWEVNKVGTSPALETQQRPLEDPLAHLPCSTILEYRKGQTIYSQDQPSTSIYLVIDGKVKVCRLADDGRQVVVDIYQPDEFFGESAFLACRSAPKSPSRLRTPSL